MIVSTRERGSNKITCFLLCLCICWRCRKCVLISARLSHSCSNFCFHTEILLQFHHSCCMCGKQTYYRLYLCSVSVEVSQGLNHVNALTLSNYANFTLPVACQNEISTHTAHKGKSQRHIIALQAPSFPPLHKDKASLTDHLVLNRMASESVHSFGNCVGSN